MRVSVVPAAIIVAFAALGRPSPAEACGCVVTTSSSTASEPADLVFLGTVARLDGARLSVGVNADGSISGGLGPGPTVTIFEVAHMFKGDPARQIEVIGDGTTCDQPFGQGETWLVYARIREGRVTADKCTGTRPRGEAAQDLVYLEGLEQGHRQGIVHGLVFRRILGADGQPALQALFEPLQVIAVGRGGRIEITTNKWGSYQLVLPPGDFEVWVERAGRAVAPRQTVSVDHGSDRSLMFQVDYEE